MLTTISNSRQRGFSLIELLVGLGVMGILLALAMPSYRVWIQNVQIRNAAESIQNGLQRARSEAVRQNQNVEFVLGGPIYGPTGWVVQLPGGAGPAIDSRRSSEGSQKVVISNTSPVGATAVTFGVTGRPTATNAPPSLAPPPPLISVQLGSSVLTAAETQSLSVTVSPFGKILMCDPNAALNKLTACN
jgi:type IV fimbrial biogenesis protein FimT